ncbi:GumC family protein [Kaistia sp. UC242_56]|uniref:GumC family protein n=1 Tax=Kaistia sp. UC242_56 TaxID=3374625 RepID=UPI00378D200D
MVIQSSPSAREPVVLRDVVAILRRRSGLLALFAVAGLGAGAAYHAHQPRLYRAEAVMALDVRRIQGMPIDQVVTPLPQENPVLRTELDRIGSRVMAQRVLAKLAAEGIDPFGGDAVPGEVRRVDSPLPTPGEAAGNPDVTHSGATPAPQVRAEDAAALREDRLRAGLKVVNDGRSYTIYIAYTAGDPDIAARVANAYARAYLAYQDDVQIDATRRVSDWLSNRLKVMAARLEQAEQEAERFRASSGLLEIAGVTLAAQRLAALNTELMAARAAHATAEAREKTAARLAADQDGLDSFTEVLGSPIIQQLRASQAQMERRLRVLKDTGAAQSAEIPSLTSELDAVRQQITQEVGHILVSLRNEIDSAARRVTSLEEELHAAQANYGASDMARVKLDALIREANADRAVYESLLARSKQIVDQNGLVDPGIRLISEATAPSHRFGLRLLPALLMGLIAGGLTGLGLVLILERLDDRVRSRRAIEAATGLPVLATIPNVPWRRRRPGWEKGRAAGAPFAEALASLQWMLRLSPATRPAASFLVTSALPREGKTTVALALARSMAMAGRSVVLVDADLHRQSLGRMARSGQMEDPPRPGLGAFLSGAATLDDILSPDSASPLRIIASPEPGDDAQERLGSARMKLLMDGLRERFDVVILDAPPVLTTSDAAQIASHVDSILFVTRWGYATHEAVLSALQKLALCGLAAPVLVLNRVERRAHQSYEGPRTIRHLAVARSTIARFDEAAEPSLAQRGER